MSLVTGDGDDTSDTLGNRRFLNDNEVLDVVRLSDMSVSQFLFLNNHCSEQNSRSTAKLDTG